MKGSAIVYMYNYKTKIRHHNSKHCDIVTFVVLMLKNPVTFVVS